MAYLKQDEALEDALPKLFARELLQLWMLTVFFATATLVSIVVASARAARFAMAAAEAASRERALTYAVKAFGGPASGKSEVSATSQLCKPPSCSAVGATTSGSSPWSFLSIGSGQLPSSSFLRRRQSSVKTDFKAAAHISMLQDELAARRDERLEILGALGFSFRRSWFKEFVRQDGGLLYDTLLAMMLIATAVYWTVFVTRHLSLYEARSTYSVYDASSTATANWFLEARADPGSGPEAVHVRTQAAIMGLDMPSQTGDPGRWLLPQNDLDWDDLNEVFQNAHNLVNMWTTYGMLQALVIIGLVSK